MSTTKEVVVEVRGRKSSKASKVLVIKVVPWQEEQDELVRFFGPVNPVERTRYYVDNGLYH